MPCVNNLGSDWGPMECACLLTLLCHHACVLAVVQSMYDSQPTTTVVPNRLSSVRELLHEQLRTWLPKFCVAVSNCDDKSPGMPPVGFLGQEWMLAGIKAPSSDGIYPTVEACVYAQRIGD